MPERRINVDYISRVEGQGGIDLYVTRDGELRDAKVRIFEPPRFFEAFMVGRKYGELMELAARICGICPVSHEISALRAVEEALGVEVSEATKRVRKLMAMSALISSHILSIYNKDDYCHIHRDYLSQEERARKRTGTRRAAP